MVRYFNRSLAIPNDIYDPGIGIRTNAGTYIHFSFYDDTVLDSYPGIFRGATRVPSTITWQPAGFDVEFGWFNQLVQAPPEAPSLSGGATIPMPMDCAIYFHGATRAGQFTSSVPVITGGSPTMVAPTRTLLGYTLIDIITFTDRLPQQYIETLADTLAMSETVVEAATFVLSEIIRLGSSVQAGVSVTNELVSVLTIIDRITLYFTGNLTDALAVADTALPIHKHMASLVDAVSLTSGIVDRHQAVELVTDLIATECLLQVAPIELLTDDVALADTAAQWARAVGTIVDALLLADATEVSARVVAVLSDSVAIADTPQAALHAMESLHDEIALYVTFRIGDEVYRGYVLNAANKAASEYTNFAFNSVAELRGKVFMAAEDGLYELAGSDDNGDAIESVIRTGLLSIADGKVSTVVAAYLGYASDNSVVLKAIVTKPSGEKEEHWYRLAEQTADVTREGRIKLGRGLKSAYWQFEVVNVGGGTLDLDNIKLHRIQLDRRI